MADQRRSDSGRNPDRGSADQAASEAYEPPAIEDLDTGEGPSVTAAGISTGIAAPRQL